MQLRALGLDANIVTTVVLGAGATAGARLQSPPPLGRAFVDADFFAHLKYHTANRLPSDSRDDARQFLDYLGREFGHGELGLEAVFAETDVTQSFISKMKEGQAGRKSKKFEREVERLTRLIVEVIRLDLPGSSSLPARCDRHEALAATLSPTDSVLSFNYDCLIDRALQERAGTRWKPAVSYAFKPDFGVAQWAPPTRRGTKHKNTLMLLKPHGSLNWIERNGKIGLAEDEYSVSASEVKLVPPRYIKNFDEKPFKEVWQQARLSLGDAKALIFAGYSLPPTDIFTRALLRLDPGTLRFVCIANPDREARARIMRAIDSSLTSHTRVVYLDTFAELCERLGAKTDGALQAEAIALKVRSALPMDSR